jgi:hypothetical protein
MKAYIEENFKGVNRGRPLAVGAPTKISQFPWEPNKIDLGKIRNIPEERITALIGVPAAVVGFGTGLQQTKVGATMGELRRLAYENCIIPIQSMILEELNVKLLPDFDTNFNRVLDFDRSNVRVLQEDENKKVERIDRAVSGGWLQVSEGQRLAGFPVDETQNVYLRKIATVAVPGTVKRKKARESDAKFAEHLRREDMTLSAKFTEELEERFERFADDVATEFLYEAEIRGLASRKASLEYEIVGDAVVSRVLAEWTRQELLQYEPHYLLVTERTFGSLNAFFGFGVNLTDEVEMKMIDVARDRTHLIDLNGQTKRAVTDAITAGREAGEGIVQISDRIRDDVGAGPWRTAKTRSEVIARTETKYAQNKATLAGGAEIGVDRYRVVDAQLGPTDEYCEWIDGQVVSASDADYLSSSEHPNGTRSFVPIFEDIEPIDVPLQVYNAIAQTK